MSDAGQSREWLLRIASRFVIGREVAEALADDVLYEFLLNDPGTPGGDQRLDDRMVMACIRHNARVRGAGLDPEELEVVFRILPLCIQRVLKLHVYEGLGAMGVASLMDVSPSRAATLIEEAVAYALREIIRGRGNR